MHDRCDATATVALTTPCLCSTYPQRGADDAFDERSASPASAPRNLTAMLKFPRLRTHAAISPVIPARDFIQSALRDAVRAGRETRPWGLFDTLETSSEHQVKRL